MNLDFFVSQKMSEDKAHELAFHDSMGHIPWELDIISGKFVQEDV